MHGEKASEHNIGLVITHLYIISISTHLSKTTTFYYYSSLHLHSIIHILVLHPPSTNPNLALLLPSPY